MTTFGLPVSRWGYRLVAVPEGTEVTEYWLDPSYWLDRRSRGATILGRIFTGRVANYRPAAKP